MQFESNENAGNWKIREFLISIDFGDNLVIQLSLEEIRMTTISSDDANFFISLKWHNFQKNEDGPKIKFVQPLKMYIFIMLLLLAMMFFWVQETMRKWINVAGNKCLVLCTLNGYG